MQQWSLTQLRLLLGYSLVLALALGVGGRDSNGVAGAAVGFLFWLAHVVPGLALMVVLTWAFRRSWVARLPEWVALLLAAVLGAMLFTPLAVLLEYLAGSLGAAEGEIETWAQMFDPVVLLDEFLDLALPFCASWLLLNLVYKQLAAGPTAVDRVANDQPSVERPAGNDVTGAETAAAGATVFDMLPSELGRELEQMTADLNYVHVVTKVGRVMVLYSLRQAAADAADQGMLVHRSHWVAYAAVVRVRRTDKGLLVGLANGAELPVSRRRARLVLDRFGDGFVRSEQA